MSGYSNELSGNNRHKKGGQGIGTVREEILCKGPVCLSLLTGSDLLWLLGLTHRSKACDTKPSVGHSAPLPTSMSQVAVCHCKIKTTAKRLKLNIL